MPISLHPPSLLFLHQHFCVVHITTCWSHGNGESAMWPIFTQTAPLDGLGACLSKKFLWSGFVIATGGRNSLGLKDAFLCVALSQTWWNYQFAYLHIGSSVIRIWWNSMGSALKKVLCLLLLNWCPKVSLNVFLTRYCHICTICKLCWLDAFPQVHWTSTSSSTKSFWTERMWFWICLPKSVLPWIFLSQRESFMEI